MSNGRRKKVIATATVSDEQAEMIEEYSQKKKDEFPLKNKKDKRTPDQFYSDIKLGKTGEVVLFNFLVNKGLDVSEPKLGNANSDTQDGEYDLIVKNKNFKIAVASSKMKAHNLLIDAKDWILSDKGELENQGSKDSKSTPSFWFAVNVDVDKHCGEVCGYIPKEKLRSSIENKNNFYSEGDEIPDTNIEFDRDSYAWKYDELYDVDSFLNFF